MQNLLWAIITQPLLNALFIIVAFIPGHDFGFAVIIITLLIRLALYPVAKKQLHSQKKMTALQPEAQKLKEKYKKDPQKYQAAVAELYKEKEVNPFGSCLPLIIQMPFLFGLFYALLKFQDEAFASLRNPDGILSALYPWVEQIGFVGEYIANNEFIDTMFLGLVDLAHPSLILAVIAGALQFVQTKMLSPKKTATDDPTAKITQNMIYIFPILTVVIASRFPAALPLYWITTTLFAIGQQYLIMRHDVEELEEEGERKPARKSKRNRK